MLSRSLCVFVSVLAASPALGATLGLTRIIDGTGVANPIHVAAPPGDSTRLFVLDRSGVVRIYDRTTGLLQAAPFFDISAQTATSNERGAYAIAFDRNYATTGRMYLSHLSSVTSGGQEFHRVISVNASTSNPNIADASTLSTVIEIPHMLDGSGNHYGGWIGVDTDNQLLVATGDSGRLSDLANGSPLLGSVLRIDPSSDDFPTDAARNYVVPSDNVSPAGAAAEVIANGFRNPYRAGYDAPTGALLVGDVGEQRVEEIDVVVPGRNYGWPDFEGSLPFQTGFFPDGTVFEGPAFEYAHDTEPVDGSSITGGEIYRGPLSELDGLYFFGDFISDRVLSLEFDPTTGVLSDLTRWDLDFDAGGISGLASFGQDADGNLYVLDLFGDVFQVTSASDVDRDVAVPLPASAWLLGGALMLLGGAAQRRRKAPTSSTCAAQRN